MLVKEAFWFYEHALGKPLSTEADEFMQFLQMASDQPIFDNPPI